MITEASVDKKNQAPKVPVDKVDDSVYQTGFSLGAKLSFLSVFFLFLSFFLNFPIKEVITTRVAHALAQNRACPLSFDNLEFEWLLPKIKMSSLTMPSLCFGGALPNGQNLVLKNLSTNILGPSFSPLGLKLSHAFALEGTRIEAMHALSPGGHLFNIRPTKINLEQFSELIGSNALKGTLTTSGQFDVDNNFVPRDVKFALDSQDFGVQSIQTQAFRLPALPFGLLGLKINMGQKGRISIESLMLGNDKSPIRGNFTGSIDFNKINPNFSLYDLKGTLSFSESFKASDEFALLNLFLKLDQQKTYEGSYKVNIRGKLNAPPSISFD